jgi:hypothetical protein
LAELSTEELSRLARNFLVGRGGEAELEDTKRAMDTDPQLALEFLQQMQTALDDAAPAGFSPLQWAEVDKRVGQLIEPLAKGGGLGIIGKLFSRLFRKRGAATPARIKRKGAPQETEARPVLGESPTSLISPGADAPVADSGMEEMAPIAPVVVAAPVVEAVSPEAEAVQAKSDSGGKRTLRLLHKGRLALAIVVALIVLLLLLANWGMKFYKARAAAKALAMAKPAPVQAVPTPAPPPNSGPPRRAQPPATQNEPLPSELPPMTPQAAGQVGHLDGLDAKDSNGGRGLPLP